VLKEEEKTDSVLAPFSATALAGRAYASVSLSCEFGMFNRRLRPNGGPLVFLFSCFRSIATSSSSSGVRHLLASPNASTSKAIDRHTPLVDPLNSFIR